jgi:hypothetical protein
MEVVLGLGLVLVVRGCLLSDIHRSTRAEFGNICENCLFPVVVVIKEVLEVSLENRSSSIQLAVWNRKWYRIPCQ